MIFNLRHDVGKQRLLNNLYWTLLFNILQERKVVQDPHRLVNIYILFLFYWLVLILFFLYAHPR